MQLTYRSTLTSIMHGLGLMPWRYERKKMNHLSRLYQVSILVTGVLLASASYADKSTEKKRVLSANKVSQENCTPFDLKSIDIRKVKGRWELIDGKRVVHDFGYKAKHAKLALLAIRQNQFSWICVIRDLFPPFIYFIPQDQVTKVVLVRHAEKAINSNAASVQLSNQGEQRAATLADILDVSGVSAAFATKQSQGQNGAPYVRTMETVNNYADSKGFDVQYYHSAPEIVDIIKEQYAGQSVLVAGHTSTVPDILEGLGINNPPAITDQFNNLFVVFLINNDTASMMHLKYEVHEDGN